jgi:putative ABC transport system permease protein
MHHAKLADGREWKVPFEAVAGALTGLDVGEQFAGVHGFAADGDDVHHFHDYTIVGRMKPTGTVLDRLILTAVESVQQLHAHPDEGDEDAADELKIAHQVTALLIKVKNPIAVMNLPRELNRSSNLLAASPSYEMTRLSTALGLGRGLLTALGAGFIVLSALMLLSVLASSLTARRYDLALLRVLGASRGRLSATILSEALVLSLAGAVLGLVCGHLIAFFLSVTVESLGGMVLSSALLKPQWLDAWLLLLGALAGLAAALVPALSAARTDIAVLLARGRT